MPCLRRLLVALTSFVILSCNIVESAVIAKESSLWETSPVTGLTIIPVCIVDGSSVEQTKDSYWGRWLVRHDPNPTLDDVVEHVRTALENTWESYSSVRFTGFEACNSLDEEQQSQTMGVYIHPDAKNSCRIGTSSKGVVTKEYACSFKPWGNGNPQCIQYNWWSLFGKFEYNFDCAEQYSVHEFGHALGFLHEWVHPKTSQLAPTCYQSTCLDGDIYKLGCPEFWESFVGTVPQPDKFDYDSIMTYEGGEKGDCAHVTGTRFGSPTLSQIDIEGLQIAYPPRQPPPPSIYDQLLVPSSSQTALSREDVLSVPQRTRGAVPTNKNENEQQNDDGNGKRRTLLRSIQI